MATVWGGIVWLLNDLIQFQAFFSVVILMIFVMMTRVLQNHVLERVDDVLDGCPPRMQATEMFKEAREYFNRRKPQKEWKLRQVVPFALLFMTVAFFSLLAYFGAEHADFLKTPSYVLGGQKVFGGDMAGLAAYQSATVFMISIAFLVAYIRTLARLVQRINSNDMRPISYYFLSIYILTAVLVTIVSHHVIEAITIVPEGTSKDALLVGVAFLVGWNPSLWLDVLWRKITDTFKLGFLTQRKPDEKNLPQDMNLLMIQGLVGDKIDRINELGIDNLQDLGQRNALVVWLRTPFTLDLIVSWIAQAMLCSLYNDEQVEKLRVAGVRDIFCYFTAIGDPAKQQVIVDTIGTTKLEIVQTHVLSIAADPAFKHLKELRDAL
ncbi:MAG: hypothetical protein ACREHE_14335 [Rhizomicrobium sp.]